MMTGEVRHCRDCGAELPPPSGRRTCIYCTECIRRHQKETAKRQWKAKAAAGRGKGMNIDAQELPPLSVRLGCRYYMANGHDAAAARSEACLLHNVCVFRGKCVARCNERTIAQSSRMRDSLKDYRRRLGNYALADNIR